MKKRSTSMKRIVNELSKLNWGRRVYAVFALCATTAIALPAQTFTTLFSFDGTDGAYPQDSVGVGGLVQGTSGDLYGTTAGGGAYGYGTVFEISTGGKLTTLYSFCSSPQTSCPDGSAPYGTLVQATNGDFYGTTAEGGVAGGPDGTGGTVFRITADGKLTTLYDFCSQANCTDGSYPNGLVQATNGDLYGTTNQSGAYGAGTVFKITPAGALTTLYTFCSQTNCTDGATPFGNLVQAANGDFYGTTFGGGVDDGGTIFKITPAGTLTTLVTAVGGYPSGTLLQATNGDLYGTTSRGTIFKMTPGGTLTTLGTVCCYSYAGLVQATNVNFYGTTYAGGAYGGGSIFEITPAGTLATLYNFCFQTNCTDGDWPLAGLMQDTNGSLYGTTFEGGAYGLGTVFSLSVGLGPFVETQTTSGKVGRVVEILGTDLTGTTSVTFNGTPVTSFTVNSSASAISTTVPVGATTGLVMVTTPTGMLRSNVPFRVLP
jgi:uncharacterized repeat protein (TIGR03803 family)